MREESEVSQPLLSAVARDIPKETEANEPAVIFKRCKDLVKLLFADEDHGVQAIGLPVGPAIPLDILRYLFERCKTDGSHRPNVLVLEALTLYLFPQFEGRDSEHDTICEVFSRDLEIDLDELDRRLSTWTGRTYSS